MSRAPRSCFVVAARRRSGAIRGVQIGAALDADVRLLAEFTAEQARAYDCVIYVKELPSPAHLEAVRRAGVRQVIDVVDNFEWRDLARRAPLVDALIAANTTHRVVLEKRFGVPTIEIQHHHCNFAEERIAPDRARPTLGYIGRKDDWWINWWLTRRLGLPLVRDFKHQSLREQYLGIDIGFAYRSDAQKRSYNSAVKLLNYMSFGIPAVVTPESGFLETARHGVECLFAQSRDEFALLLEHLAEDVTLRRRLGEAGFEAARPYHIRRISERYRRFLAEL